MKDKELNKNIKKDKQTYTPTHTVKKGKLDGRDLKLLQLIEKMFVMSPRLLRSGS